MEEKSKNNIQKEIKKRFAISLVVSVMFVLGLPATIIGATKGMWWLAGPGIGMLVLGFYGTPIAWMGYSEVRSLRSLLASIKQDGITEVAALARAHGIKDKAVVTKVNSLISKRYLTGVTLNAEKTEIIDVEKKIVVPKIKPKCEYCGASVALAENGKCPYCGNLVSAVVPSDKK